MINLSTDCLKEGVYYLSPQGYFNSKENLYLKVRTKERRIYDDETLELLPLIKANHQHFDEWQFRKITADNLVRYFSKYSSLSILDVGAGNCWLSNLISSKTGNTVFAIDLNEFELKQGAKVFNNNKKLKIIYGDIFMDLFDKDSFDTVLFASSIQYFSDLVNTINKTFNYVRPGGSIFIADSNFYKEDKIAPAEERTKKYYDELGIPEAAKSYFHHSYKDLFNFNPEIIENRTLLNKILSGTGLKKLSPFPLIKIDKH